MKRYNKLGVAAAAGVIAFLVMAAVAFGDTGSEDCIPIVTTDDTDEVGEDEQMDYGGKWLEEQSELYDIGTKYGCDDIAERPQGQIRARFRLPQAQGRPCSRPFGLVP